MAWALKFDGVNDYAEFGSPTAQVTDGYVEICFIARTTTASFYRLLSDELAGSGDHRVILETNGDRLIVRSGGSTNATWSNVLPGGISDGDEIIVRVATSGTVAKVATVNGVGQGSQNTNETSLRLWEFIGVNSNQFSAQDLKYIHLVDNIGSNDADWDATASSHASGTPVLTDTISGNDATGVNMPTDGSAWLDLGGGGITLTGTAVPTQTETDIVTGGKTIILTLAGDTFVTGSSSEDGIASGSDSDIAASGTNWDSLIKTDLDNTDVVLSVGDTVATITLPAYASYDIPATETITWTIPAASLTTGTSEIIATPTHTVTPTAAGGTISPYYYMNLLAS